MVHIMAVINFLFQTKRGFAFSKIGFCASKKVFEEALNAVKFLGWLKKFGPAQNILGPVKGIRPLKGSQSKEYSEHEHPCHRIKKTKFRLSSNLRQNS